MSNKYKTLLITCTGRDYNKRLRAFCEFFSKDVDEQSIDAYNLGKNSYDFIVIGPTYQRTMERDIDLVNAFNDLSFTASSGIIVLGDSNSPIMKNMGNKIEQINNHSAGKKTAVHNIKHFDGAELFIPSMHHTTFIPDDVSVFKRDKQHYINLIALSFKRDEFFGMTEEEDEVSYNPADFHHQEPEIFILDTYQYLGIYGAPEFFFDGGEILPNHHATHTMTLISHLIEDL